MVIQSPTLSDEIAQKHRTQNNMGVSLGVYIKTQQK